MKKLAWFGRFVVFLLTAGYAFPHVCNEGMDIDEIEKKADSDWKQAMKAESEKSHRKAAMEKIAA